VRESFLVFTIVAKSTSTTPSPIQQVAGFSTFDMRLPSDSGSGGLQQRLLCAHGRFAAALSSCRAAQLNSSYGRDPAVRRLEVELRQTTRSRHLSSYHHTWANVCIRVTAKHPGTTPWARVCRPTVKVDSLCRVQLGGADHDHKLRSEANPIRRNAARHWHNPHVQRSVFGLTPPDEKSVESSKRLRAPAEYPCGI
jgi:hypothetical protein